MSISMSLKPANTFQGGGGNQMDDGGGVFFLKQGTWTVRRMLNLQTRQIRPEFRLTK